MTLSKRYRNAAKLILSIGCFLCAIVLAGYGVLILPAVKGVPFNWDYIFLILIVTAIFALIPIILAFMAKHHGKKEILEGEDLEEVAQIATEEEIARMREENSKKAAVASVDCKKGGKKGAKKCKLPAVKYDKKTLKKIGLLAIPAIAVGLVAISVTTKKAKNRANKARRRRDLYDWLG